MYAVNTLPDLTDKSDGFLRRLVLIRFINTVQKKDPNLFNKITTEDYEYLLYQSILAINKAILKGELITLDESVELKKIYQ